MKQQGHQQEHSREHLHEHHCGREGKQGLSRFSKRASNKVDACCPELRLRMHFKKYHRFFLFSPLVVISLVLLTYTLSRSGHSYPIESLFTTFLLFIVVKEFAGISVSRRIYRKILMPLESLKNAVHQISEGNYEVEVQAKTVPEIKELIEAFNAMSEGLRESEALKQKYECNRKELIASISHDLKTPITSINGFIDGIVEGVADTEEKRETYYKIIQQNARYMNRLIDDLLLYSKLDLHKMNFEFKPISMGRYISELFDELRLEAEELGVVMNYENALSRDVEVNLDSRHFTRAIRNIFNNAVTHGHRQQPEVFFKLFEEPDRMVLCISDNGEGIPAEQLEKIFDRFYRGDASRGTQSGGSGLGLAITREIVQAHGGGVVASSELGSGTTICIQLKL